MRIHPLLRRAALLGGAALTAASAITMASAHVGTVPGSVEAGTSATVGFRIGHGCEGSPTNTVRMQIPEGVVAVTPEAMPGWDIETVLGPVEPYEAHGATIAEDVTEITWAGGSLPDDQFAVLTIRATFPDAPGETLYFPVVQECDEGEHAWIEIPEDGQDGHDLESPAPTLQLVEASSGSGHGDAETATSGVAAATDRSDDGVSTIAWVAFGLAALGLVVGAGGLATALRNRR